MRPSAAVVADLLGRVAILVADDLFPVLRLADDHVALADFKPHLHVTLRLLVSGADPVLLALALVVDEVRKLVCVDLVVLYEMLHPVERAKYEIG